MIDLRYLSRRRIPVILQSEAAECGLVSVAMVACAHGLDLDVRELRTRFGVSQRGATLNTLVSMAAALHMKTRAVKLDLPALKDLRLPCILHWDMNHFVVLTHASSDKVSIHDPAVGLCELTTDEVGEHFTGVALELWPGESFVPRRERRPVSPVSLMGRLVGVVPMMGQVVTLGILLQLCVLATPYFLQWVIDEALVAGDANMVAMLGIGFILLVVFQVLVSAARSWWLQVLSSQVNFQWMSNAFSHLLRLPNEYFERRHLGDILQRFQSLQVMQRTISTQFAEAFFDGIFIVVTLLFMFCYSVKLSLVTSAATVLYLVLRMLAFPLLLRRNEEVVLLAARQQSQMLEATSAAQTIKLHGQEAQRHSTWLNSLARQTNAELKVGRLQVGFQSASLAIFRLERIIVIWLAAMIVIDGRMTVGMLVAFLAYKDHFAERAASLIDRVFEWRNLRAHAERLADIILSDPEPLCDSALYHVQDGGILLQNICYGYGQGDALVLDGLNLSIPDGQCVAITGPSGCGKSTLVKLLSGMLRPTCGSIHIGGINPQINGWRQLREHIGVVMQEDKLLAGTVAENIAFFAVDMDMGEVVYAAKQAGIHAEIASMPMGYNSLVGELGSGFSGGQRQRILLARALYRKPKILLLDEATSHLDVGNEMQVNAIVAQTRITRVIVAHRPQTLAMAERVVVIVGGKIVRDFTQEPQVSVS